ncbi:NB-ARC domain protein [Oscillatoriales cyanobacterium USR001]|nr:NB-ARC domain protein [Oscillatoriales cyanobacterium USR001]
MVGSLRASKEGLDIVEQARKKKGWTKTALTWCEKALTTEATLKRFWRLVPIQQESFTKICEVVGVDWENVVDENFSLPTGTPRIDWEQPIDVSIFYGRKKELATLEKSVFKDRLAIVSGLGGIGKTTLVGKLWENIKGKGEFEYVIQRSLCNKPPLSELLNDLIEFLSDDEEKTGGIFQLMGYLRKQRCLLILDNVEAIMSSDKLAGFFCPEYQDYSDLIKRVKAEQHKSCLLLISWERPKDSVGLLGEKVGFLRLSGLEQEAQELLKAQGLLGTDKELETLNKLYAGNPGSLKLISALIQELFDGRVQNYLRSGTIVVVLNEILAQHFSRLSDLETKIMINLAMNSEPSSLSQLIEEISSQPASKVMEAVNSLINRSLIEKISSEVGEVLFSLLPEVRKYVKSKFVK